jgi:hypothetical protein
MNRQPGRKTQHIMPSLDVDAQATNSLQIQTETVELEPMGLRHATALREIVQDHRLVLTDRAWSEDKLQANLEQSEEDQQLPVRQREAYYWVFRRPGGRVEGFVGYHRPPPRSGKAPRSFEVRLASRQPYLHSPTAWRALQASLQWLDRHACVPQLQVLVEENSQDRVEFFTAAGFRRKNFSAAAAARPFRPYVRRSSGAKRGCRGGRKRRSCAANQAEQQPAN